MEGRGRIISNGTRNGSREGAAPDLLILFKPGERPTRESWAEAVGHLADVTAVGPGPAAVTALHGSGTHVTRAAAQVELQMDAMTFDCSGFAPGDAEAIPTLESAIGISLDAQTYGAGGVGIALGPHVAGGAGSLPILRGHLGLAAKITSALATTVGVCWTPARLMASLDAFSGGVAAWNSGGGVPVSLLVSFRPVMGSGIQSRGLSYFTGQELRMEGELASDQSLANQLGLRIAAHLIHHGKLVEPQQITAPDGRPLRLEPSRNGRFVRVWLG